MAKTTKTTIEKDENTIDNSLELIKYASEVQSRIKEDINSDFVLGTGVVISDKERESIKEMTNNAYLSKRTIQDLTEKKYWFWNKKRKEWVKEELDETTKKKILNIADQLFDTHMIRHQMTVILNRNKEPNPLLNGLMGTSKAERQNEIDEETILQRLESKAKKKGDKIEAKEEK